jgi:hypothetical protein
MARYYFHIYNGVQSHDNVGTECTDSAEVRLEAVEALGEIIRGNLLRHKDVSSTTVNVVDEVGKTVMIVSLAASVEIVAGSSLAA